MTSRIAVVAVNAADPEGHGFCSLGRTAQEATPG